MSTVLGIEAQPGPGLSTTSRLCTNCLKELPLDQFRPRGHGSEKRHSWCRTCRNERERSRRDILRAKRERRRMGHLLTAIRTARNERELEFAVRVMLRQFGGLSGFTKTFAAYHRFALHQMEKCGRPNALYKSMDALLRVMAYVDDLARRRLPELSDSELRQHRDRALLEMVADDPVLLLNALRGAGWTVQPPSDAPLDSCEREPALSGG